jgi:N-acetylglucosamine-6-phosphate deacetylase
MIGGQRVFYRDGKCVSAEGTLGGSALTMVEAIANCVHQANIPLAEALRMATLYPAEAIGMDHELGHIAPGYPASLVILGADLSVQSVIDQGRLHSFNKF